MKTDQRPAEIAPMMNRTRKSERLISDGDRTSSQGQAIWPVSLRTMKTMVRRSVNPILNLKVRVFVLGAIGN